MFGSMGECLVLWVNVWFYGVDCTRTCIFHYVTQLAWETSVFCGNNPKLCQGCIIRVLTFFVQSRVCLCVWVKYCLPMVKLLFCVNVLNLCSI